MNRISKPLYKGARVSRDINAIQQCFKQGSIMPLIKLSQEHSNKIFNLQDSILEKLKQRKKEFDLFS